MSSLNLGSAESIDSDLVDHHDLENDQKIIPFKINGISDVRLINPTTKVQIPIALERVQAGFPSPAQDYIDKTVDLNEHLIKNVNSTFIMKVDSLSMLKIGIDINDELIVDRSLEPKHKDIVVAVLDNQLTVKRLMIENDRCWLKSENEDYSDIDPRNYQSFEVWGVVTKVIKSFK